MAITKTSSQNSTPSESSNNIQKSFFPYQRPVTRLNWRVIGKHIITNQKSSILIHRTVVLIYPYIAQKLYSKVIQLYTNTCFLFVGMFT